MHHYAPAVSPALFFILTIFLLLSTSTNGYNITNILEGLPDFSVFNRYLTKTHLADDINDRDTITICAVDNAGMEDLVSKNYSIYTIKNVLSLHVLLDYFGAKKLHEITDGTALSATLYQATGTAPGSSGFVNITDLRGGKVGFSAAGSGVMDASFIKSLKEIPYNISIIQISKTLSSPEAAAPSPAPTQLNLSSLMSAHGCKIFAETLLNSTSTTTTFDDNVNGGLTIFCPSDDAMKKFLPKFKNFTAEEQESLLEYHGIPVYMSLSMLKTNNGPINTLATNGDNKFNFVIQNDGQEVTLKTKIVTAKILSTLKDEDPLAIFVLDKVLVPRELFNASLAPNPAPAPAHEEADSPAVVKHKSPPAPADAADSPVEGPASESADQSSRGQEIGQGSGKFVVVALSIMRIVSLLL